MSTMNMKYSNSKTPWSAKNIVKTNNLNQFFCSNFPQNSEFFPKYCSIHFDPKYSTKDREEFVYKFAKHINSEITKVRKNFQRVITNQNSDLSEDILKKNNHIQPWIIYYGTKGGFGEYTEDISNQSGLIPCTFVRHHAVGWYTDSITDKKLSFLATTYQEGGEWDFDSDFGHESCHASFAPIPLFVQSEINRKADFENFSDINLKSLSYTIAELSVVILRNEKRDTQNGLPIIDTNDKILSFLTLSSKLFPYFGYNELLKDFEQNKSINKDFKEQLSICCLKSLIIQPQLVDKLDTLNISDISLG